MLKRIFIGVLVLGVLYFLLLLFLEHFFGIGITSRR